jgi:FAD/FMN-containing dehydrogenase
MDEIASTFTRRPGCHYGVLMAVSADSYADAVARLRADFDAIAAGSPVRLAKRTSNLFRARAASAVPGLDVSSFDGVLAVDPVARTADVLGMTTYEHLVDATLAHGLMPLVVPQLKTITLGGAVTGLGIESSSFRNGFPHESVLEMDVLVGDGRIVTAAPGGEDSALYYGFPNSYGTLGYSLRLRIELAPVRPYVRLTHLHFDDAADFVAAMEQVAGSGELHGEPADFVDGTVFSDHEHYVTVGTFVDHAPFTSDYTGTGIYYRSIQNRHKDYLTVRDYLWRWDTDWFWCSRALGVQHPAVRRIVPKRYLRSDVYAKIIGFERRHHLAARLDRWRGKAPREVVVQDIEVPVDRAAAFLEFFHREIGIDPIWVCPVRQRRSDVVWDLYSFDPSTLYVNVGFWSSVEVRPGDSDTDRNRMIERVVAEMDGRKSLYSTAFYDRDTFWATYNGPAYEVLKKTYDPGGRLADLYDKVVRQR